MLLDQVIVPLWILMIISITGFVYVCTYICSYVLSKSCEIWLMNNRGFAYKATIRFNHVNSWKLAIFEVNGEGVCT